MQDIAALIKQAFKVNNSMPNHCLDGRWLTNNIIDKLNPKEIGFVQMAIDSLVQEGFITIEDRRGPCMVLTNKGYEEIYPINREVVIGKIGAAILHRFAETQSNVGHIVDARWINLVLVKKYNPKEIEYINDAISDLIDKGLVKQKEDTNDLCLVLQQEGYDAIY